MGSIAAPQAVFFPKADAAVLSCRLAPPPTYPNVVGPVFDPRNADAPCLPWSLESEKTNYPYRKDPFAPVAVPEKLPSCADHYLRASLARNE